MGATPNAEEFLGAQFVARLEMLIKRFWNAQKDGMTFYNEYRYSVPDFRPDMFLSHKDQLWHSETHLFDECKRVFFRLTQYSDGALVPLWDLETGLNRLECPLADDLRSAGETKKMQAKRLYFLFGGHVLGATMEKKKNRKQRREN